MKADFLKPDAEVIELSIPTPNFKDVAASLSEILTEVNDRELPGGYKFGDLFYASDFRVGFYRCRATDYVRSLICQLELQECWYGIRGNPIVDGRTLTFKVGFKRKDYAMLVKLAHGGAA
ncbi:hypothetical protein FQZ97_1166920 [compost metagenome]